MENEESGRDERETRIDQGNKHKNHPTNWSTSCDENFFCCSLSQIGEAFENVIRLDSHLSAVRGAMKNGDWPRKRKEVDGVKMISQDEYEIIEDEESIKRA